MSCRRKSQEDKYETEDEEFFLIGDRVLVDGKERATVTYFGEVDFGSRDYVGIAYDNPVGFHSGKIQGKRYFQCQPFHGSFVRPHRLTRIRDSAIGSSRVSTPASYYYDEDYRQESKPTISSLAQRLNSISVSRGSGLNKVDRSNCDISRRNSRLQSSDTRSDRTRAQSVFNFRPKREYLDRSEIEAADLCRPPSRLCDGSSRSDFSLIRNTIKSPPYKSYSTTPDSMYSKYNYDTGSPVKSYDRGSSSLSNYVDDTSSRCRSYEYNQPKFDETDLDIQLKKSLLKSPTSRKSTKISNSNLAKPVAVKYTFSKNLNDGNPTAIRNLIYE